MVLFCMVQNNFTAVFFKVIVTKEKEDEIFFRLIF
jgi:hypothetical protein